MKGGENMSNDTPSFWDVFPKVAPDLKIKPDLANPVHGPHFDGIQAIPGGTDQIRVTSDGDVIGGTTNIGKSKISW